MKKSTETMDIVEYGLLGLIEEFEADNWSKKHPKGSPRPASNQFCFADFCNWLHERQAKRSKKADHYEVEVDEDDVIADHVND